MSACGGGGGGGISVQSCGDGMERVNGVCELVFVNPPPDPRAELRQQVAEIGTLIQNAGLPQTAEEELLEEVRDLESAIESLRNTVAALEAQIRALQMRLEEEKRLAETPCGAGMEKINGVCECAAATPRRVGNECLPPLTVADCNGEDKILSGGACVSCAAPTPRRVDNECRPAALTVADCNNKDKILQDGACVPCEGGTPNRVGNECRAALTVADCNGEDKILSGGACVSCGGATPRRAGNECMAALTVADCNGEDKILSGGACVSCGGATPRRAGNECMAALTRCEDGSMFADAGRCRFRTREYGMTYGAFRIDAAYAYEKGFFGRGVTVAVVDIDGTRTSHNELSENAVTARIATPYLTLGVRRLTNFSRRAHGTGVAGVIAASQNNTGMHGVAPRAKYIPFVAGVKTLPTERYIAQDSKAVISNRSYGFEREHPSGMYKGIRYRLSRDIPYLAPLDPRGLRGFAAGYWYAAGIDRYTDSSNDIVHVWAAGNDGWNGSNRIIGLGWCEEQDLTKPCGRSTVPGSTSAGAEDIIKHFVDDNHGPLSELEYVTHEIAGQTISLKFSDSHPGLLASVPLFFPDLKDNWLAVVATRRLRPSQFRRGLPPGLWRGSNGCGPAKEWCVAAPGEGIVLPGGNADDAYNVGSGTSFAAPQVSGALAVLKSAVPEMPMEAVRAVLLTTALDLGAPGIDDVFGWGEINLSAGIDLIENMKTAPMGSAPPVPYRALRAALPPRLAHLGEHLEKTEIAIHLTNGLYYNLPLSRMYAVPDAPKPELGKAAGGMLADSAANKNARRGFFAFGDVNHELGVAWRGETDVFGFLPNRANMLASFSHAAEEGALSGADLGALGTASASSNGGKIGLRGKIAGNLSAFGEAEYRGINAGLSGALLQTEIRNAESSGWKAGAEYLDMFGNGGVLRLSAERRLGLSGGGIALRYPHAEGDFYGSLVGGGLQTPVEKTARIPLARRAPLVWTLGYAVDTGSGQWAAAAEYAEGAKTAAFSATWRVEF